MASSRIGILVVVFLSIAFLPLISSTFFPGIPGLLVPRHHIFNPHFIPETDKAQEQENGDMGGDDPSTIFLKPGSDVEQQEQNEAAPKETGGTEDESGRGKDEAAPAENGGTEDESRSGKDEAAPEGTGGTENEAGRGKDEAAPEETGGTEDETVRGKDGLRDAFYKQSCPQAEEIVNKTIHKHFRKDPSFAPSLVRLYFHDCFVTGCDASILLDTTPTGEDVEKKAIQNGPFVRGYEVIDDIKSELEAECPGMVSCADILAFANRDSLVFTGVPNYEVAAGRRDGVASLAKNVDLPIPESTPEQNIQLFQKKGMSLDELVVLIGAHSIGSAHCRIVSPRFHDQERSKEIDPGYLFTMQTVTSCQSDDQVVAFDPYSQHQMDSRFYKELLTNKALIESDHKLAKEARSRNVMNKLVDDQQGWLAKFTSAVKKLGEIEVLTGDQGEIRKQCRAVN